MTTPQLQPDRSSPPPSNEPIALAPSMIEAVSRAHAFAPAATPIFLYGENGTGKTFFAEYIHVLSGRSSGFHAQNAGSWSSQLAADELFGHVKGAFTDAGRVRAGCIAAAETGTLLLDEMHTLDLSVQKQLLQVLDRGTYRAVGSDRVQTVACRIVLAMAEDPDVLVERGQLLKDLRYRFGMCAIWIPPLRERRVEIPRLADLALRRCPQVTGLDGPTRFSDAALAVLCDAEYRGNVRQLEGGVLFAYLLARHHGAGEIRVEHLPAEFCPVLRYVRHGDATSNWIAVRRALTKTGGNVQQAARLLGISRNWLNVLLATERSRASAS